MYLEVNNEYFLILLFFIILGLYGFAYYLLCKKIADCIMKLLGSSNSE